MASTADIIGVYIADIITATGTATTGITVPMGIMAIAIARTATMVIGDTVTAAMGRIEDIGQGALIVAGADFR